MTEIVEAVYLTIDREVKTLKEIESFPGLLWKLKLLYHLAVALSSAVEMTEEDAQLIEGLRIITKALDKQGGAWFFDSTHRGT